MTPADLKKEAGKGPYKGIARSQIIRLKIADKKEFTLNNGAKIKGTNWDEKTYTLFVGTRKISLKEIKKDPDFGGGGSGAGADVTAIVECGQALVCSLIYNVIKKEIKWEDLTYDGLQKAMQYCDLSETFDTIIERSPPEWVQSYVKSANILYRNYKMLGTPVYFHRGSKFMNEVYSGKKIVFDADKKSDRPQAPGSFSDDKWNPGDIWMTTLKTVPKISTDSWSSLNKDIYDLARAKKLVGVSLKKVGASAHIEEYNALSAKQTKEYRYASFRVTSASERGPLPPFFNSIDLYMSIGDREVQFRATSGEASWQGEIKGATAAGGKIGGGIIFQGAQDIGISRSKLTLPNQVPIDKPTDADFKKFAMMFKELSGTNQKLDALIAQAKAGQRQDKTWWMSKYIGIDLVYTVMKEKKQDALCKYIYEYASSATKNSSIFIKYS